MSSTKAPKPSRAATVMYAAFTPLVHLPMLLADPSNAYAWSENALNLALIGVAWAAADSLGPKGAPTAGPA